jgi:hypothetical protein
LSSGNGITFDAGNNITNTSAAAALTTLNVSNQNISYLTGIEGFTGVTSLNCGSNLEFQSYQKFDIPPISFAVYYQTSFSTDEIKLIMFCT